MEDELSTIKEIQVEIENKIYNIEVMQKGICGGMSLAILKTWRDGIRKFLGQKVIP